MLQEYNVLQNHRGGILNPLSMKLLRTLQGANANSVERSVVRELFVRYFESGMGAKREVLEIIAKTLLFSEEDMVKVGLARRGFLTTILGDDTSKDSVSEKWVEFLMRETEDDIATDTNRVTAEEEKNSFH